MEDIQGKLQIFRRSLGQMYIIETPTVCKTTEAATSSIEIRSPVCKTTEASTCKTVDIIDNYLSYKENPRLTINLMKMAKDGEVFVWTSI